MEEDPFKRYIMHTYGARGVAMVRSQKGPSGDLELDRLARQIIGFHCDDKNCDLVKKSKEECFLDDPGHWIHSSSQSSIFNCLSV